jgi:hypothetical protein
LRVLCPERISQPNDIARRSMSIDSKGLVYRNEDYDDKGKSILQILIR